MSAKRWVSGSVFSQLDPGSKQAVEEDKEQSVWEPGCKGPHRQLPSGVVPSAGQSWGNTEWGTWGVQQPERPRQQQVFRKQNKQSSSDSRYKLCDVLYLLRFVFLKMWPYFIKVAGLFQGQRWSDQTALWLALYPNTWANSCM